MLHTHMVYPTGKRLTGSVQGDCTVDDYTIMTIDHHMVSVILTYTWQSGMFIIIAWVYSDCEMTSRLLYSRFKIWWGAKTHLALDPI